MNGVMKPLNDGSYQPSYDVNEINRLNFNDLSLIKLEIESELTKAFNILTKNKADMETSLVSQDGFPRSDINVIEVRNSRVKIIKLRNDLEAVINEISEKIHHQFTGSNISANDVSESSTSQVPFANIIEVSPDSPASIAKLEVDDKVLNFGNIDVTNHNGLKALGHLVKNTVNKPIELKILRNNEKLRIEITPTNDWPGNGLLGCRFVQI